MLLGVWLKLHSLVLLCVHMQFECMPSPFTTLDMDISPRARVIVFLCGWVGVGVGVCVCVSVFLKTGILFVCVCVV